MVFKRESFNHITTSITVSLTRITAHSIITNFVRVTHLYIVECYEILNARDSRSNTGTSERRHVHVILVQRIDIRVVVFCTRVSARDRKCLCESVRESFYRALL